MRADEMLKDIGERLEKLNIYDIRQIGRVVGVHRPADGKKSRVIEEILGIASGEIQPIEPSRRGAPPKSKQYDEGLVADVSACRQAHLTHTFEIPDPEKKNVLRVNDSAGITNGDCKGVLTFNGGRAYLHINGTFEDKGITVHDMFVARYSLREGDLLEGRCIKRNENDIPAIVEVYSINGTAVSERSPRRDFDELTHIYPQTTVKTEYAGCGAECRIIDLFAPVALGQRGFIKAPSKSEKSELLKSVATGISRNYPHIKVVVLLIDELPEVISDFKSTLNNVTLFYTTFASPRESHIQTARIGFEYAKRQVEEGGNVIILFDGVTRLARAYGENFAAEVKKLLFCACNAEEGGSLTVLSTLIQTEEEIFSEFSPLSNMDITLSAELAEKRLFPAIDVKKSFADREEKLLSKEELVAASKMRKMSEEEVLMLFGETSSNAELIKKLN